MAMTFIARRPTKVGVLVLASGAGAGGCPATRRMRLARSRAGMETMGLGRATISRSITSRREPSQAPPPWGRPAFAGSCRPTESVAMGAGRLTSISGTVPGRSGSAAGATGGGSASRVMMGGGVSRTGGPAWASASAPRTSRGAVSAAARRRALAREPLIGDDLFDFGRRSRDVPGGKENPKPSDDDNDEDQDEDQKGTLERVHGLFREKKSPCRTPGRAGRRADFLLSGGFC